MITESLIRGLAEHGPTALLLGFIIAVTFPLLLKTMEKNTQAFRDEMRAERDYHKEDISRHVEAIDRIVDSQAQMTAELRTQTAVLHEHSKLLNEKMNLVGLFSSTRKERI